MAILSGVAIVAVTNTRESARVSKLESDVATINAAIQVYTISGGSLPTSPAGPQVILDKLKTRADATTGPTVAGLRGNVVDLRLIVDPEAPDTGQPRALWNGTTKRFVIATTGSNGAKNFLLDDAAAATAPVTEARVSTVKTGDGNWVWDYTDVAATARGGPGSGPGTSTAPSGTTPTPPMTLQLDPPDFSQAGGPVPLINFDLSLTLSNPNPPGTSQIFYSVNGGGMSRYDGQTLTTNPGMSVSAYAVTSDLDHWTNSNVSANTYTAVPVILSVSLNIPAANLTYAQAGGAMTSGTTQTPSPATVTLDSAAQIPIQYLTSAKFQVYYTLDGTSPLTSGTAGPVFSGAYASPSISVAPANWGGASSVAISAAARAIDTAMFANSPVVASSIGITTTSLSAPTIDPPSGSKAADLPVSIALASGQTYPVGARIYYTLDGTDPGNTAGNPTSGTLYTGQMNSGAGTNGVVVVTAQVYGPAGFAQWFTPSPATANTYQTITFGRWSAGRQRHPQRHLRRIARLRVARSGRHHGQHYLQR